MADLAGNWSSQFYTTLDAERETADELREASLQSNLTRWTTALTGVVVRSFEQLGFSAASKGYRGKVLPVRRNEYLSQDITVFPREGTGWRFPIAVCELENSTQSDLIAYSLWKVLCVRCALRVVFCYRPEPSEGSRLVSDLSRRVIEAMPLGDRMALDSETLIVLGSRNESGTFPYGFFQAWKLNSNIGRFELFARK